MPAQKQIPIAFSIIESFIKYRKASQNWCSTYETHLMAFNAHCVINYPDEKELNQKMINTWCKKRETESNNSCRTRIFVIVALVEYANFKGIINIEPPVLPKEEKRHYIPHAFTDEELKKFFYACDTIDVPIPRRTILDRKIMSPVVYRLLYSTGMRTTEVRLLKREDVDLETGVININKSKGYNQHYVVMHESMLKIMREFDLEIEELYPSRTYFFPSKNDGHISKQWITENFNKSWYKYNKAHACAYDLRHNYAITNINSWENVGVEFNSKLLALSKSMGHSSIESTMYYYSLVPGLMDKINELKSKSFDNIIPEVYENE